MLSSLLLSLLLAASTTAGEEAGLTPQEALGQRIFEQGEGADGREIPALLGGEDGFEVAAALMPCASCHGSDGKGREEGGLRPSDITWPALTRPYGASTSGRQRGPYDEALAQRAIVQGIDAAGQPLHIAMPRYRLSDVEAAALVAYLRKLGAVPEPGVEANRVHLGVLLPPAGPLQTLGEAIRAVLTAAADQVNAAGGLYGRRLMLHFLAPTTSRRDALARLLEDEEIFAFVASYLVGEEAEVTALLSKQGVPLVGPFIAYPQIDTPPQPQIFYLTAGLPQQAQALVDFAAQRLGEAAHKVMVFHEELPAHRTLVAAIRQQAGRHGGAWSNLEARTFAPGHPETLATLAASAHTTGTDTVFFLGRGADTESFLQSVGTLGWRPRVLLLGKLASGGAFSAPPSLHDRIFLALPTLATDIRPKGFARYHQLREKAKLPDQHLTDQITALAAWELMVEALEHAGRQLSRDKLIAALEDLVEFDSGLTPPLTYGPNRRTGALGAYVVTPDFARRRLPGSGVWMALDDASP